MWSDLSYLLNSKTGKKILRELKKPKLSSQVAKKLNLHIQSVCRSINSLQKRKMVRSITPERGNFRFFKITAKGSKALKILENL